MRFECAFVNGRESVGVEAHSEREHNRKVRGTRQYISRVPSIKDGSDIKVFFFFLFSHTRN